MNNNKISVNLRAKKARDKIKLENTINPKPDISNIKRKCNGPCQEEKYLTEYCNNITKNMANHLFVKNAG